MRKNELLGRMRPVLDLGTGFFFNNLGSRHIVTSDDVGNVKSDILAKKPNGLTPLIQHLFRSESILSPKPEHGDNIIITAGSGQVNGENADGIIYMRSPNNEANNVIAFITGDCPLILIEGKNKHHCAVGIIHSGWKGTVLNIAAKAVAIFTRELGIKKNLNFGLWTGICPNCFEIGKDVRKQLRTYKQDFIAYKSRGKWLANLGGIINRQLLEAGIDQTQIEQSNICPHCLKQIQDCTFSSHRRGDQTRNGAFIQA